MSNHRRLILMELIVLVCLLSIGLANSAVGKVRLHYMIGWMSGDMITAERELVVKFMRANPDIEVSITSHENLIDKFPIAAAAGSAPDIAVTSMEDFPSWQAAGFLMDLSPFFEKDKDIKITDFEAPAIDFFKSGHGIYGIASSVYARGLMVYNVDLFEANGLLEPKLANWNWETFRGYARKLTRIENNKPAQLGVDMWLHPTGGVPPWIWSNGAEMFSKDFKQCLLDRPEAVKVFEFLASMAMEGISNARPGWGAPGGFYGGKVGMADGYGPWNFPSLERAGKETGLNVRLINRPWNGEERNIVMLGMSGFVMSKGTKHPQEAWRLLKYLVSPEVQRLRAKYNYGGYSLRELNRDRNAVLSMPCPEPKERYWSMIPIGRPMPTFVNVRKWSAIFDEEKTRLLKGEVSPQEFAERVVKRSEAMLR